LEKEYRQAMKKLLLSGIAALFLATGTAHAEHMCKDPSIKYDGHSCELDISAEVTPSGDPQWPLRLMVKNDTDREVVDTDWLCSNEPHPPGIGRYVPGIRVKGGRMAPHSAKSWVFRAPGNPLGEMLPFCKELWGHGLLKRGAPSQLNEPDERS
jgi:hypothetical protein